MATGLEALGAASAVVQLIAFAGSLVSLSFKIYDGIPTPENELEEYSNKMMEAASRVQSRGAQVPQGTQVGNKLSNVSQECIDTALKLRKEAQTLTKRYKNGKGKIFKAVYSAFRTESHKTKLNQLNESLKKCKELMETELLLKICDQDTAIAQQQSQGFRSLEVDVQNLILKIAEGYTRVEQLVSIEAQATRDAINTHVTSELKALEIKKISDNQRQRLLKSLKPEEIRERYNSVLPSSDACFERVFASYERVCRNNPWYKAWKGYKHTIGRDSYGDSDEDSDEAKTNEGVDEDGDENSDDYSDDYSDEDSDEARNNDEVDEIDLIWDCFSTWLQSDDKLFWIRGKPGSGKSTLIKFVLENDNTKRLLHSRRPNTRILSHFFWKIGNEPQNSIRGLLCSLLYDLLSEDDDAMDKVLTTFKFSGSKDFYKEWSSQEAEKVLLYLLDVSAQPRCIFVDGLDEVSDKDGYQALISVIQKLTICQGVKVCVSSRPETELVKRLEKIGAQSLRLEDLTKPEMAVYLCQEFEKLPQDQSAGLPLKRFTETLLAKAQGVFLWLALATKSVTDGILIGDDQEFISKRLEELPEELESLYRTMWERLNGNNRVYRETAARYLRFVIADGWDTMQTTKDGDFCRMTEPNLVQLSLAIKVEDRFIFPPKANEKTLHELNNLCNATECDIRTRCAGMLQVGRQCGFNNNGAALAEAIRPLTRPVQFIHRTAHDFLVDTEYGQSILNYRSNETTLIEEGIKLLKCRFNLASTYYSQFKVVSDYAWALKYCNRLNDTRANPEAILTILVAMKGLHEDGALALIYGISGLNPTFPCVAAYYLENFDDFIISCFMPTPSPKLATNVLHELALASQWLVMTETSIRIIRGLIELGGEAHVAKRSILSLEAPGHEIRIAQRTTALESFLGGALNCGYNHLRFFLGVVESMVQTSQDLHRRFIIFLGERGVVLWGDLCRWYIWVAVEVDLQFLINRLLAIADLDNIPAELTSRTRELAASFTRPYTRARHIVRRRGKDPGTYCYRVLDQESCLDVIDSLGYGGKWKEAVEALVGALDAIHSPIDSSAHPESSFPSRCFKEVPIEEEMDMLIQEGIGLYREEDINIG
ncbi:small s protein [Fusarium fujikuroi]|nr:small s protein [Fusarium fujikuroi]